MRLSKKSARMKRLFLALLATCLMTAAAWADDVATVPVATVRSKPAWGAERVTQVPLGDRVHVIRTLGAWVQVLVPDQYRLAEGYPGYMLRSQVGPAPVEGTEVLVTVPRAVLRGTPSSAGAAVATAFMGTHLESTGKSQGSWLEVSVPGRSQHGWVEASQVSDHPLAPTGSDIIRYARELMGTPYVWGGLSAEGIDCSGLTFIVYRIHGITLPRDADQQFLVGEAVDHLLPGDLVFYGKARDHITHVALYAGKGEIVEASGSGGGVRVSTLHRRRDYQGARRVIGVHLTMPPPSP